MRLSVLDQSPVIAGHTPARAIEETLKLARRVEELGYSRYWLAEHHAIAALADPCPEILLARLGAETKRIRIGTGGVLLPYYSAFKVAEIFRMLEALYPGRLDLGIGRAPGGDARTARAVGGGRFPDAENFPQQVWELVGHLDGTLPDDHPEKNVRLQPGGGSAPEVWLLGSSDYSGLLAAQLGLRFAFAHFINPRGGDLVMRAYKERFQRPRTKRPRSARLSSICDAWRWPTTSTRPFRRSSRRSSAPTTKKSANTSAPSVPARSSEGPSAAKRGSGSSQSSIRPTS